MECGFKIQVKLAWIDSSTSVALFSQCQGLSTCSSRSIIMIFHSAFLRLTTTTFFSMRDNMFHTVFLCLLMLLDCVRTQSVTSTYTFQTATSMDTQYDPNAASCFFMDSMSSSCAAATPDFYSDTTFAYQASCLCYISSTIYAPGVYDSYFNGCVNYLSTAASTAYISLVDGYGPIETAPCISMGNIRAIPTTSGASSTIASMWVSKSSAPIVNSAAGSSACAQLRSQYSACTSNFPGIWATLAFTQQASCLCYTSTTLYAPTFYDSTYALCVSYLSAFSSADYSSLYGDSAVPTNLCSAYGNVRDTTTTTTSTTDSRTTTTAPPNAAKLSSLSPLLPTSTTRQSAAYVLKVCTFRTALVLYLH